MVEDLLQALNQMENKRSPKLDDLPSEFSKRMQLPIGRDILNMPHEMFKAEGMREMQNQGLIKLIPENDLEV